MKNQTRLNSRRLVVGALRFGWMIALISGVFVASSITTTPDAHAQAEFENNAQADKVYWQDRYRRLRDEAVRLRKKGEVARTAYAAANRRNYRRGTNRREQREIAIEAETELIRVEAELAGLAEEARKSGALPGWLREVEDEPAAEFEPPPASTSDDEDEGRNPLYPDE